MRKSIPQECIPVGCVPSAAVAVSAPGGVPGPGGGGVWSGGVPGAGVSGPGGLVSQHALRQTPPVNRITDRCKNITFATSLRTVKMGCSWHAKHHPFLSWFRT